MIFPKWLHWMILFVKIDSSPLIMYKSRYDNTDLNQKLQFEGFRPIIDPIISRGFSRLMTSDLAVYHRKNIIFIFKKKNDSPCQIFHQNSYHLIYSYMWLTDSMCSSKMPIFKKNAYVRKSLHIDLTVQRYTVLGLDFAMFGGHLGRNFWFRKMPNDATRPTCRSCF